MKKEKRITIADIARISGYSKTAVSFAFNSPEKIGAEACARILEVAKEYDFVPNPLARSLSLGKHKAIGFLLPQDINKALSNPYILEVIKGIGTVCQDKGYMLTIIPPLHNSIPEAVKSATVDGIITMGFFIDLGISDILRQRKLPVVAIDGEANKDASSVTIDDEEAAFMQMNSVLKLGHRRIAVVTLPQEAFASKDNAKESRSIEKRKAGYRRALKRYGLSWDEAISEYDSEVSYSAGIALAKTLTDNESRPSAVVTMSDIVAIGLIQGLKDNNIMPGKDIAIVGFDGIDEGGLTDPPLATISQPGDEKGRIAAALLFQSLDNEESNSNILMPCKFIARPSLGETI